MTFYCMVVGSRTFQDYKLLSDKLDNLLQNQTDIVIISGGARGADSLAERYAKEKGLMLKVFPADWSLYGKRAGFIRNKEMVEYISGTNNAGCIAFWDGSSKGTKHSIRLAQEYKVPTRIIMI